MFWGQFHPFNSRRVLFLNEGYLLLYCKEWHQHGSTLHVKGNVYIYNSGRGVNISRNVLEISKILCHMASQMNLLSAKMPYLKKKCLLHKITQPISPRFLYATRSVLRIKKWTSNILILPQKISLFDLWFSDNEDRNQSLHLPTSAPLSSTPWAATFWNATRNQNPCKSNAFLNEGRQHKK